MNKGQTDCYQSGIRLIFCLFKVGGCQLCDLLILLEILVSPLASVFLIVF